MGFDQFRGAFLSTGFLALGLALFQQFVDDAGSWIARSKTSRLPNQRKLTVLLDPCKKHQFELPVDCNDDVEMFPASPHDRDVMPKARGVMKRKPLVQQFCDLDMFGNFVKNSNPLCDVALGM